MLQHRGQLGCTSYSGGRSRIVRISSGAIRISAFGVSAMRSRKAVNERVLFELVLASPDKPFPSFPADPIRPHRVLFSPWNIPEDAEPDTAHGEHAIPGRAAATHASPSTMTGSTPRSLKSA